MTQRGSVMAAPIGPATDPVPVSAVQVTSDFAAVPVCHATAAVAAVYTAEPVCHSTAGSAAFVQLAGQMLQHLGQAQVQLDRPVQQQQFCQ